jgi:hypothetical protein
MERDDLSEAVQGSLAREERGGFGWGDGGTDPTDPPPAPPTTLLGPEGEYTGTLVTGHGQRRLVKSGRCKRLK